MYIIHNKFSDAKIELYLKDTKKFVDIFIPSLNKIIECYGDYWHCNPILYKPDYYHKIIHKTAQEIWDKDKKRIETLQHNGYIIEIVWEHDYLQYINGLTYNK